MSARDYFTPAHLERAEDFRNPQRLLGLGVMGIELGLLILLVARPPARLNGPFRRPLLVGAATGAALSVALTLAPLPVRAVMRDRAMDVGLVTQSWGGWAEDLAKSTAIGVVVAGAGSAIALGLMRRFPRHWWALTSAGVVALGVVFTYAGPVVLDPIFNKFDKLPPGQTRSDVLELAERADVDVGEVYVVDGSRRGTAANAYVNGIGATKRVVLYDTLLDKFTRDEVRLVVAHELGHVKHRDVTRGLLFLALVAPAALFAGQLLTERLAPGGRSASGTPAVLPSAALALAVLSFGVTSVANQLSRDIERSADQFSLAITNEPEPFISLEKRLSVQNVGDPDPPEWVELLFSTHPPAIERIGMAVAFERRS